MNMNIHTLHLYRCWPSCGLCVARPCHRSCACSPGYGKTCRTAATFCGWSFCWEKEELLGLASGGDEEQLETFLVAIFLFSITSCLVMRSSSMLMWSWMAACVLPTVSAAWQCGVAMQQDRHVARRSASPACCAPESARSSFRQRLKAVRVEPAVLAEVTAVVTHRKASGRHQSASVTAHFEGNCFFVRILSRGSY